MTDLAPLPSDEGFCDLCEDRPVAPGDVLCAGCRAEADARSDTVLDPVERLLSDHGRMEPLCTEDLTVCRCGQAFSGGPGYHRRHVAELIYEALGVEGPQPWVFGEKSPSRARFENGRIVADTNG